jgi:hypothetical protein
MKTIITIALSIFSTTCFSFESKLACEVQSTHTHTTGRTERNNGKALVEVSEQAFGKAIFISSAIDFVNNLSVSTYQRPNKTIEDFSDPGKWDVGNTITKGVVIVSATRIIIDRNSGLLIINRVFNVNGGEAITSIDGKCEKIDTTKRKF